MFRSQAILRAYELYVAFTGVRPLTFSREIVTKKSYTSEASIGSLSGAFGIVGLLALVGLLEVHPILYDEMVKTGNDNLAYRDCGLRTALPYA
jgi:hypothetical protein